MISQETWLSTPGNNVPQIVIVIVFGFLLGSVKKLGKKWMLLFSKDTFKLIKIDLWCYKSFIFPISAWTFYSSKNPQKCENVNVLTLIIGIVSWAANQHIRMITIEIQHWITGINYILKYIHIESCFTIFIFLFYFWSNKCNVHLCILYMHFISYLLRCLTEKDVH